MEGPHKEQAHCHGLLSNLRQIQLRHNFISLLPDLQLPSDPKRVDFFHCLFSTQILQHIIDKPNR